MHSWLHREEFRLAIIHREYPAARENPHPSWLLDAVTVCRTKVMRRITKGACPWDIYSLTGADEMFDR
jgi:hypothetical protein